MSHAPQSDASMHVQPDLAGEHAGHPGQKEYVVIALILAVLTAIEVGVYYVYQSAVIFIVLAAVKFALVAMFFMHLKYDNRFFSIVFITGIALAVGVFLVFLTFLRVFFV